MDAHRVHVAVALSGAARSRPGAAGRRLRLDVGPAIVPAALALLPYPPLESLPLACRQLCEVDPPLRIIALTSSGVYGGLLR